MKASHFIPFFFFPLTLSNPIQRPLDPLSIPNGDISFSFRSPVVRLHRELCVRESITYNERHVGHYLARYLANVLGLTVEIQPVTTAPRSTALEQPKRFNVFAYPGHARNSKVILSSHIDTVPPYLPYEITSAGEIWGRGSVDAKGSVASQIAAYTSLVSSGAVSEGDLSLLFVVGEETGGDGMHAANDLGLTPETVIFGEPTDLQLACGHKGMLWFKIHAQGKAGHSGYPWLAVSANDLLLKALNEVNGIAWPSSEKYGNSTVNIGRIVGGVAANVIPEKGEAEIAVRLAGGTVEELKQIVKERVEGVGEGVSVQFGAEGYGPIDIDCDVDDFTKVTVNYGTDIPNLQGTFKRYLYGPGDILVAHSDHEHISVADLEAAVEGYKKLVLASLQ